VRVPAYIEAPPREGQPSVAVPSPVTPALAPQGDGTTAIIIGTTGP